MPSLKPHGQMSEAFITALFLSVSGGSAGRLYLSLPRQGLCQRSDRQHRADVGPCRLRASGARPCGIWSPCAPLRWASSLAEFIRLKLKRDAVASLASAGGAVRDPAALRRGLSAAGAEPAGQFHRLLLLRDAGAGLPQGERLRLRQHHVHRQPAQRHGFSLCMAGGRQRQGLRQGECTTSPSSSCSRWVPASAAWPWLPMAGRAIWLSCLLLGVSFCLMFLKEDIEELEEFEHLEHDGSPQKIIAPKPVVCYTIEMFV